MPETQDLEAAPASFESPAPAFESSESLSSLETVSNEVTLEELDQVEAFLIDFESKLNTESEAIKDSIDFESVPEEAEQYLLNVENPEKIAERLELFDEKQLEVFVDAVKNNDIEKIKFLTSDDFDVASIEAEAVSEFDDSFRYEKLKSDLSNGNEPLTIERLSFEEDGEVTHIENHGKEESKKEDKSFGLIYHESEKENENDVSEIKILLHFENEKWNLLNAVVNIDGDSAPEKDIEDAAELFAGLKVEVEEEIEKEDTTHYLVAKSESLDVQDNGFKWFTLSEIDNLDLNEKAKEIIDKAKESIFS